MAPSSHFLEWVSNLATQHSRDLAGVARREGLSSDDALDAVQEAFQTFLRIPQARAIVEDLDDSRNMLVALVRNAARNMRRRHFRARPHDDVSEQQVADGLPPVDELLAQAEQHVAMLGCLTTLGEVQQRVIVLRMLDELSGEETARELGVSTGHVAVLLHRAKKDLTRCVTS